jgi:CheY-like chemotaxis protein
MVVIPGGRALSVLVADPHIDGAESLAEFLRLCGHEVAVAHNGPEAVAAAERSPPDVLIVEPFLPGSDGWAVARAVLRREPRTLCVAVSTLGRTEDRRRSADAGFALHLVKPVGPDELVAALLARAAPEASAPSAADRQPRGDWREPAAGSRPPASPRGPGRVGEAPRPAPSERGRTDGPEPLALRIGSSSGSE